MENRIEECRKPLGLAQHILGKKVGLSRTSINKLDTWKSVSNLKTANDIANALGVCIYQVFDLDGTAMYSCLDSNCLNSKWYLSCIFEHGGGIINIYKNPQRYRNGDW